jgi:hypothetical protein
VQEGVFQIYSYPGAQDTPLLTETTPCIDADLAQHFHSLFPRLCPNIILHALIHWNSFLSPSMIYALCCLNLGKPVIALPAAASNTAPQRFSGEDSHVLDQAATVISSRKE